MKELQACIDNDVGGEGTIGNLRWIYYADLFTIGIAKRSNFDRWANSRLAEIHPWLLSSGDPTLTTIVMALAEAMK